MFAVHYKHNPLQNDGHAGESCLFIVLTAAGVKNCLLYNLFQIAILRFSDRLPPVTETSRQIFACLKWYSPFLQLTFLL